MVTRRARAILLAGLLLALETLSAEALPLEGPDPQDRFGTPAREAEVLRADVARWKTRLLMGLELMIKCSAEREWASRSGSPREPAACTTLGALVQSWEAEWERSPWARMTPEERQWWFNIWK